MAFLLMKALDHGISAVRAAVAGLGHKAAHEIAGQHADEREKRKEQPGPGRAGGPEEKLLSSRGRQGEARQVMEQKELQSLQAHIEGDSGHARQSADHDAQGQGLEIQDRMVAADQIRVDLEDGMEKFAHGLRLKPDGPRAGPKWSAPAQCPCLFGF